MSEKTIAAISTALGSSGIGIVRISGEKAIAVADRVFRLPSGRKLAGCKSHTIHYGYVYDGEQMIDEVLALLMRGPKSFTTEDTVELHCHGGVFVVKRVLDTVLRNGAQPAEPGEFTKRAFLGGRIDLSQAEAVMELIQSQNEYALKASVRQLKGDVSDKIRELRGEILHELAFIEAALDDPEHYFLDGYGENMLVFAENMEKELTALIDSFENGRQMVEGIKTVIVGKPNAGKSSILNLLTGEERAIVTDIAGTTRDVLEENIILDGINLRLLDTAGIRDTSDPVESIGVGRAWTHIQDADLILYVADSSSGIDENDRKIIRELDPKKTIVLVNKTDLDEISDIQINGIYKKIKEIMDDFPLIPFSARTGTGLGKLKERIKEMFFVGRISFNDQIYITNARHKKLLDEARESIRLVKDSAENGVSEDLYSIDLMDSYEKLGLILGEEVEDDLVDEIFRSFCMGK